MALLDTPCSHANFQFRGIFIFAFLFWISIENKIFKTTEPNEASCSEFFFCFIFLSSIFFYTETFINVSDSLKKLIKRDFLRLRNVCNWYFVYKSSFLSEIFKKNMTTFKKRLCFIFKFDLTILWKIPK